MNGMIATEVGTKSYPSEEPARCSDEADVRMVIDLHGYPVWEAVELATQKVQEAWTLGYQEITLIHGSPNIYHHAIASALGRGGIKWRLRGCLARREWMEWVYHRRSKKHDIGDGAMTLALRKNPCPERAEAQNLGESREESSVALEGDPDHLLPTVACRQPVALYHPDQPHVPRTLRP